MMKLLTTLLLTTFLTVSTANALVYLEPYVGLQFGSGDNTVNDFDLSSSAAMGLRVGGSFTMFAAGLEYSIWNTDYEVLSVPPTKSNMDIKNLGLFFRINPPVIPLHFFARYIFDSKAELPDATGATSDKEYSGSGYGLGVGFTGLPFICINAEMNMLSWDEVEKVNGTTGTLANKKDSTTYALSVSVPFDL